MKQNKNFFDELEQGWEDVLANTYEQANTFTAEFTTNSNGLGIVEEYKYYEENIEGKVTIPEGVNVIDNSAFKGCPQITSVRFPNTLWRINRYAFMECDSLEKLYFNNGPTFIEDNAFSHCKNLKNVNFPDTLRELHSNVFSGCGLEGNLIIPDSVVILQDSVFSGCRNLNGTLTLGNKLVEIGDGCFANCSFTGELTIPESVKRIGRFAFNGCNFSTIYVKRGNEYKWNKDWNLVPWNYGCNAEIKYY